MIHTLEILRDFTHETLEGQLADEQVSRLLILANLSQCDSSRPEAMRLLHTTSGGLQGETMSRRVKQRVIAGG
jgi:hypothetical protein